MGCLSSDHISIKTVNRLRGIYYQPLNIHFSWLLVKSEAKAFGDTDAKLVEHTQDIKSSAALAEK